MAKEQSAKQILAQIVRMKRRIAKGYGKRG